MAVFITSGIVGSYIPVIIGLYLSVLVGATPDGFELILIFLAPLLVGSLSGYLVFKLYERRKSPSASAKGGYNLLSALFGFIIFMLVYQVYIRLF